MKRKKHIGIIGCLLAIALLVGIMAVTVSADSPVIEFLNPLGQVEPVQNLPLAERLDGLNDSTIRLLQYGAANSASVVTMTYLQAALNTAGATALTPAAIGGTVFDARTATQYDTWAAGADAVIIGVLEDNVAAWWAGYHAREIEARGVPVVVLTTDWLYSAVRAGAQDNGLAAMRIVSIPNEPWADTQGYSTGTNRNNYISANIVGGAINVGASVIAALTDDLTANELSSAPLSVAEMGIPNADGRRFLTVPGTDESKAMPAFYDLSMELGFGDGLPLVIPTQEAVDDMIAGQGPGGRAADEILGKVMLRGGIMTVEKVAANAVMAGARPEHFPLILAVMEAYATGWEDNKLFYREIMDITQRSLIMIVSGPIVGNGDGQLDLSRGRMLEPGKDDSAVIGRAVMLSIRNIGHIAFENSNVIGGESRFNPHELAVLAESNELLPAGWETLSEHMGFEDGSNTVTLLSVTQSRYNTGVGGTAAGGTAGTFDNLGTHRTNAGSGTAYLNNAPGIFLIHWRDAQYAAMTDTRSRVAGGFSTAARGISSKSMLQQWLAGTGGTVTENGASPTTNITRNLNREALVWPIVAGYGHSTQGRVLHAASADYNDSRGFQTQRIGGITAPSAPRNLKVIHSDDGTAVELRWSEPARGAVVRYEVSGDDGHTWIDVGLDTTYTFSGLDAGQQYFFAVRARSDIKDSVDVRAPGVVGAAAQLDWRASGRGAWAYAETRALPGVTTVNITGPAEVTYVAGETATYTVRVEEAYDVAAVQLTLQVDGNFFDTKSFNGLDGFTLVGDIEWKDIGGGIYEGTIVLASEGASGNFDVFEIEFNLKGLLGTTEVELIDFKLAFEGGWVDCEYGNTIVATSINQWFSPYDLNMDGVVDLRDISIAMMHYMAAEGDANWAEAKIADVNGDGVVDTADLVLIRANFT